MSEETIGRELIIDSRASEVDIALMEDGILVELQQEKINSNYVVGDIYLGRVKKILPGLNAAFVDVGSGKEAFLHFLDLGLQASSLFKYYKAAAAGNASQLWMDTFKLEPDINKTGKISDFLNVGDQIPIQIAKEPISTKGPRITAEISFAGRYLILTPFSNRVSVSQKIRSNEERNRLKKLVQSIRPNNYGIIIRTAAEDKKVDDIDNDLRSLVERWENITKSFATATAPSRLLGEMDRTSVLLRDLLNESFNNIQVNDGALFEEMQNYVATIAPQKLDIVKLYKGKEPIFEHFGIEKQIKGLFGKIVTIKNGVYLVIEHTEAMHVIDVNSGHRLNKEVSQEDNALAVNLDAAKEIARQLRLRDMGGIIIVDFIDMREAKHRHELYEKLKEEMAKDHAKHTILPATKFGLIQITRQRVRPVTEVQVQEHCPLCDGTGKIRPTIVLIDEIESNVKYLLCDQNEKSITLVVHPFIHAYLTKGLFSIRKKWMWKYRKRIKIRPSNTFHFLQYAFLNRDGDDIAI